MGDEASSNENPQHEISGFLVRCSVQQFILGHQSKKVSHTVLIGSSAYRVHVGLKVGRTWTGKSIA